MDKEKINIKLLTLRSCLVVDSEVSHACIKFDISNIMFYSGLENTLFMYKISMMLRVNYIRIYVLFVQNRMCNITNTRIIKILHN